MRAAYLYGLALVVGACFDPVYPTGATCGANGRCPGDQVCDTATNTCRDDTAMAPDSGVLGDADPVDAAPCSWNALFIDACADTPGASILLTAGLWEYDTTTGELNGPEFAWAHKNTLVDGVRVVWTERFETTTGNSLQVVGEYPLLIVATDDVAIQGTISASSTASTTGAVECKTGGEGQNGDLGLTTAGGGSGGAFQGDGGRGGPGLDSAGGASPMGSPTVPPVLRLGCEGGNGRQGNGGVVAAGGAGGGAVGVVSLTSISLSGTIEAGGRGGGGGMGYGGGGGAGSGGMVVLDAPALYISGVIAANGGGGGGGAGVGTAQAGEDGRASAVVAGGGLGIDGGGAGGDGSAVLLNGVDAAAASASGGGGGGGAGFVVLHGGSVQMSSMITPAPSIVDP